MIDSIRKRREADQLMRKQEERPVESSWRRGPSQNTEARPADRPPKEVKWRPGASRDEELNWPAVRGSVGHTAERPTKRGSDQDDKSESE